MEMGLSVLSKEHGITTGSGGAHQGQAPEEVRQRMRLAAIRPKQAIIDAFAKKHGPCCAGCDWWRWYNSVVGDCTKSAPVGGHERMAMLGVTWSSLNPGAGHVMTHREHVCGEFSDSEAT